MPKQVSGNYLVFYILDLIGDAVCNDDIELLFELVKITNHSGVVELIFLKDWLIDDDFNPFCLDPFMIP
jgi:hypothetical protein